MNLGDSQAGSERGILIFPPQINVLQAKKKFEILDAVRTLWVPSEAPQGANVDFLGVLEANPGFLGVLDAHKGANLDFFQEPWML